MAEPISTALIALGTNLGVDAAIVAGFQIGANAVLINLAGAIAIGQAQKSAADRKRRKALAAAAQDRHITLRSATAPRREVLGRAVTGGDLMWAASTGASKDTLVMVIALSARRIDAVEKVYVGGEEVTLDGSGYVTSEPFQGADKTSATQFITYSGAGVYTLAHPPIAGTVSAMWPGTYAGGYSDAITIPVVGVSGNTVTLGSAAFSGSATVTYQRYTTAQALRILFHLGVPGDPVDPVLNALFPTEWDSDHRLEGIAYAVVVAKYSPNAFYQGLKNISFLVRGSLIHDPRTGITAWSDNPALLKRHMCLNPLDPSLPAVPVSDAWAIAAANVCDQVVSYTVDGAPKTRKRYIAGTIASDGEPPRKVLDDLAQAMAGGWVFSGGELRMRAGAYGTPVMTLTDADFGPGEVSVVPRTPREQLVNVANGKAFDPNNRWQYVDVPEVRSSTYITEDGAALPLEVELPAVPDMAQAQQILAVMLRESRSAWTITANFRMRAYPLEVFDTVNLQCTRYLGAGVTLPCLVLARSWSMDGGIVLTLRATSAAIYADGTAFDAPVIPPANLLPVPWQVAEPTGITITSAEADVGDATQSSRMRVSWAAYTDRAVLTGGAIQIQYRPADEAEPAGDWPSVTVSGRATAETIAGVQQRRYYLVRLRAWNGLAWSAWSPQQIHLVAAAPLIGTAQIEDEAVVKGISSAGASNVVVNEVLHVPDGPAWRTEIDALPSFTASGNYRAVITASGSGRYTAGSVGISACDIFIYNGAAYVGTVCDFYDNALSAAQQRGFDIARSIEVQLTSGASYEFKAWAAKSRAGDTCSVVAMSLRVQIFKR